MHAIRNIICLAKIEILFPTPFRPNRKKWHYSEFLIAISFIFKKNIFYFIFFFFENCSLKGHVFNKGHIIYQLCSYSVYSNVNFILQRLRSSTTYINVSRRLEFWREGVIDVGNRSTRRKPTCRNGQPHTTTADSGDQIRVAAELCWLAH